MQVATPLGKHPYIFFFPMTFILYYIKLSFQFDYNFLLHFALRHLALILFNFLTSVILSFTGFSMGLFSLFQLQKCFKLTFAPSNLIYYLRGPNAYQRDAHCAFNYLF